ncbi:MAG: hypothetical protein AAGB01_04155 [Cyanobacteria bacterium P01_F01_bin.42]
MTPNMLRQLWSLVESTQSRQIRELDDRRLVDWLLTQMTSRSALMESSEPEKNALERYIREHLLLIRDIADDNWGKESSLGMMAPC